MCTQFFVKFSFKWLKHLSFCSLLWKALCRRVNFNFGMCLLEALIFPHFFHPVLANNYFRAALTHGPSFAWPICMLATKKKKNAGMQTHTQHLLPRQQQQDAFFNVSDKEGMAFQPWQHPPFPSGEANNASRCRSSLGWTLCLPWICLPEARTPTSFSNVI